MFGEDGAALKRHMHFRCFRLFAVWGALALLLVAAADGPARAAQGLTVKDIRIGLHPDKTRIVLELNDMARFRVGMKTNPPQLLIDLPAFSWQVGRIGNPKASVVSTIRQGALVPGFSRVAVDLKQPVIVKDAFLLRASEGRPDRLVIDCIPASAEAAARAGGKVFGLLETGGAEDTAAAVLAAPASAESVVVAPPVPPPPAVRTAAASAAAPGLIVPPRKPVMDRALPPPSGALPLIVIDPGHGGVDPGAIGANGIFEKHVSLAMAKELAARLKATGRYNVALTRDTDTYLRLSQRVAFARSRNADLFISLHADSIGKGTVRGASLYTLSEKASDEQTAKLAERENKADIIAGADLSHEDEQVAGILIDIAMRDTMNQSKFFANTVADSMKGEGVRLLDSPNRSAGFAVLKAPDIPSILIEMGFMSNKSESQMLSDPAYRRKIAQALAAGIDAYFEKVRRDGRS